LRELSREREGKRGGKRGSVVKKTEVARTKEVYFDGV